QIRVENVSELVTSLDRAWALTTQDRPGPVLFEVTGDVLRAATSSALPPLPAPREPRRPDSTDVERLARLLGGWRRPLLMVGGGVISAGASAELTELAERLGAPVFHSLMGKAALPSDHALAAGLPWKRPRRTRRTWAGSCRRFLRRRTACSPL